MLRKSTVAGQHYSQLGTTLYGGTRRLIEHLLQVLVVSSFLSVETNRVDKPLDCIFHCPKRARCFEFFITASSGTSIKIYRKKARFRATNNTVCKNTYSKYLCPFMHYTGMSHPKNHADFKSFPPIMIFNPCFSFKLNLLSTIFCA